jgi:CubicO group peptidase (beta-lactamase class C family)
MKTKRPLRAALLALTGLLLLTCVPVLQHTEVTAGQTPAEPAHWYGLRNRLDSLTQTWNQNRFNGCVLVAERGRIVYATGLGYEDRSSQAQPIDTASRFELASVSKPITAVAVLQLMERGLIDLDRPYADYVAEFPDRRITVRMLLNHTSGLPDYLNDEWRFKQAFRGYRRLDNDSLLYLIIKHRIQPTYTPGKRFSYSNTGYALLANLVERVSGSRFETYLHEHIFQVAGMHNSFAARQLPQAHEARCVRPYRSTSFADSTYYHYRASILGDKGVWTTAADLWRFDRALRAGLLLKAQTLETASVESCTTDDQEVPYGLGWRLRTIDPLRTVVYHQGYWYGFNPSYTRYPFADRTIIVLHNNTADFRLSRLVQQLEEAVESAHAAI